MTTKYEIVPAMEEHVDQLVANIAEADAQEIYAATGYEPRRVLRAHLPYDSWAALADGEVFCLFGLVHNSFIGNVATPWLICSKDMPKHSKKFLRGTKLLLAEWLKYYDLVNYVDARHTRAIRWLKWLGFELEEAKPFGPFGLSFHRFKKVR